MYITRKETMKWPFKFLNSSSHLGKIHSFVTIYKNNKCHANFVLHVMIYLYLFISIFLCLYLNFEKDCFLKLIGIKFQIFVPWYFIDCWQRFVENFGLCNFFWDFHHVRWWWTLETLYRRELSADEGRTCLSPWVFVHNFCNLKFM